MKNRRHVGRQIMSLPTARSAKRAADRAARPLAVAGMVWLLALAGVGGCEEFGGASTASTSTGRTGPAAEGYPAVFTGVSFAEGQKLAQQSGKLFLAYFTATWCGPCQAMKKRTWPDADVEQWVRENAVAVAIDVDKHQDVAQANSINAMPTMVLFKGNREIARTSGGLPPARLLQWLKQSKAAG